VFPQVVRPLESDSADLAFELSLGGVDAIHVSFEAVLVREHLVAQLASEVWFGGWTLRRLPKSRSRSRLCLLFWGRKRRCRCFWKRRLVRFWRYERFWCQRKWSFWLVKFFQ
jgi:hypothetical protein